ncbi:predicted protein [Chaetoceros tenuissimus]|uniref:Uncharacterized protein n=1 Tax=Chaetoceros tenuissimus TaxID=426638 RepID=A0AAD3HBI6_9STRA|nr:predicted protein [Chaetoceros tenuissimus]
MNHSFKNLPRAKEVNEQQGAMYSTETSLPGKITFGEFQQQIYVRAPQPLKGKEENKNDKMVMQSILRNAISGCQIDIRLANKPSNAVVSNLKEEDTVRRPKSILRNQDAKFPVDRNLANRLHLLTDDDEEEKTHEELLLGQSNCLNANSHVGAQKKTPAESKADEASSHISSNARRHHVNAYTGCRINGSNAIYNQDAGSYLASFLRKKRRARRYPSLVIYHSDDEEEEKSISSVMHTTSQQKIQKNNGSPITDDIEKFPNARFARNIAKSSNVVRKDRITVEIKKSFRGSYRDRSDTYLRQFELDNRGTVCSKDLHEQGKLRLRAIARRHLYIPVDRRATLIELGDQNSKGKWQGKHFCSSLSMIVEEEIELDVSTLAPNESTRTLCSSSTTLATSPPSVTIESTKPELGLNTGSTASSIVSGVISSSRPSDPFPSSQSLFKVTKNGKRRKLNPASDGIINATYSRSTSLPYPSPSPSQPVEISVMAMAKDCQMQKAISTNDSNIPFQKSLTPTSPESRQTSKQESPLQQTNVSTYCLSSRQDGYNDIDRRKRRKRYRQSEACTSQHSHTTSLVQESPMTNENVPIPSSSTLAQSGLNDIAQRKSCRRASTCTSQHSSDTPSLVQESSLTSETVLIPSSSSLAQSRSNDIARRKRSKRNRRASTCTSQHSSDTPSLVEESLLSSSPSTKDRGKLLKSNQRSVEASLLLLLPVGLLVSSAIEHALTHCNSKIEKTVIKEQTPQQSDETRHRKEMFRARKANHLPLSVLKKQRQVLQLVETSGEEGFEWIPICIKQAAKKASKEKKKGSKELISRERLQRRAFTRRRRHTPTDINMKKLLTAHLYREKRGNASKVKSKKEKKGGGRSGSRRVLGTIQEETLAECRDGGFLDSLENPSISCIKTS